MPQMSRWLMCAVTFKIGLVDGLSSGKTQLCPFPSHCIKFYIHWQSLAFQACFAEKMSTHVLHLWNSALAILNLNSTLHTFPLRDLRLKLIYKQVLLCGHALRAVMVSKVRRQLRQWGWIYLNWIFSGMEHKDWWLTAAIWTNYWCKGCEWSYFMLSFKRLEVF